MGLYSSLSSSSSPFLAELLFITGRSSKNLRNKVQHITLFLTHSNYRSRSKHPGYSSSTLSSLPAPGPSESESVKSIMYKTAD